MKNIIIILCLCLYCFSTSVAQDLKYDIVKGKKNLGELNVSLEREAEGFNININSRIKFWFFGTRRLFYSIVDRFKNNNLLSASTKSTLNDKTRHETLTVKEEGGYSFCDVHEEEISYCDTSRIKYTIAYMYFKEPININKVYSETHLQYLPLEKVDTNRYKITLPNGTTNYFTYENGLTKEVEVNHVLAKFYFRRKY